MSDLTIEIPTDHTTMDVLKPRLDSALQKQFPGGLLKRSWDGDVLALTGPGASGTIVFENGKLVGRAALTPPASLMRGTIEDKITVAMQNAAVVDETA